MNFQYLIKEIQELKSLISPSDCYMRIKTLSEYSGISERKLRALLYHPFYPLPSYKVDGSIRVKKSEFDSWVKSFRLIPEESKDIDELVNNVMKNFQEA